MRKIRELKKVYESPSCPECGGKLKYIDGFYVGEDKIGGFNVDDPHWCKRFECQDCYQFFQEVNYVEDLE